MTTKFRCAVVLVLVLAASVAQAQSLSLDFLEFVVNTTNLGTQGFESSWSGEGQVNSVASNRMDRTIVVWEGEGPGDTSGIFGRLFVDGAPLGGEFRINTTTDGEQNLGIVAMNASGNFVVAWAASNPSMPSHRAVFAQRYDANGLAQGSEIKVTSFSKSSTNGPVSIAMDDAGNFVIAYMGASKYNFGWFADGGISYFQRYNALGQAQGKAVSLENASSANGGTAAVAMNATNGNFVITWNGDTGVVARRYSSSGKVQGSVQSISTSGKFPSVAMDDDGDYVISWTEGSSLCAQVFHADGTSDSSFQYAEDAHRASVSMDGNQILFAYIKVHPYISPDPYDPSDVFVVRFDRWNNTLEDLQVSDPAATADQHATSVALTGVDEALVVWSGPNPNGTDGEDVFGFWLAVTTP
ncbi:MAG: hypothetical protein ACYC0X_22405 [Pirellulaceae bacterium]